MSSSCPTSLELPFETTLYEQLPFSTLICRYEKNSHGEPTSFVACYGNRIFSDDWKSVFPVLPYLGVNFGSSAAIDATTLSHWKEVASGNPHPFLSYLPSLHMQIHFEPIPQLPEPYIGFYMTKIPVNENSNARVHFLDDIRQIENSAVLMRVLDNNRMETVFVSEAFAIMMETDRSSCAELLNGPGFYQIVYPEDRPLVRSIVRRRISDEGGTQLTVQLSTAKKRTIWTTVQFSFIDDYDEHYVYCTYNDVTVLKEYEERLRSVYVSLGTNFYQQNQRTLSMFRVNLTTNTVEDVKGSDLYPTDVVNNTYSDIIVLRSENYPIPSERSEYLTRFERQNLMSQYLRGNVTIRQMIYSRRPNGTECYVEYAANLTRHPMTGDMIAFITEQECNNDKVREVLLKKILTQQFDMVAYLANGHYGVVFGDESRVTQGSIFPVTPNGEYEQYLNNQVFPVLSGSEEEKENYVNALSLSSVEAKLRGKEPYVVNIPIEMDGVVYYKRFDYYSIDPDSRFYIILKSDTTDIQRKQILLNEQLKTALSEARDANAAKTSFLSNMSHEIRTPMNAIIGLDSIALKEPDLPAKTREHLEKIGGSARHLLGLINDILDMSRIESGRIVFRNEEFSFHEFLDQINTIINGQCMDKGLQYNCIIRGDVDDYFIGDDMKLKQIFINILGNAVKFTNAPGVVTFEITETARFENNRTLRFTMRDTGIGMDKDYLPKLFEPFTQEDGTATNKYGGSGLGMAITKNFIEMMNGTIDVESEKGVGSTFTVTVTLLASGRSDTAEDMHVTPQDLKVLVIDDDQVACQHARIILEESGVHTDTALSGKEALEIIRLNQARLESYNVILMDLRMPEQDGVEVTREIREILNDQSTIIILTSFSWEDVKEDALKAGIDGFVPKPLSASAVIREVARIREKRNVEEETELSLEGRHILLAEDVIINAEIMIELLSMQGIQADHASNGLEAVEMFSASPVGSYDAILMDVRMPVLDGLSATANIRALDRSDAKRIPIIAMTANAFDEDVQRSLQAGMNAHLSKPVEPERLFNTLKEFLKRSSVEGESV